MIDYQMHTVNSDGTSTIEEMIQAAERIGLREICITDHFSPRGDPNQLTTDELPNYFKEVDSARKHYSVKVKIGLEVEYYEELDARIERALSELPWDFVLGSVHNFGGFDIDSRSLYGGKQQSAVYLMYFDKWKKAVESRLFDVMAHPDYLRRWAVPFYGREFPFASYQNMLIEALSYMARNRVGFEVNCGGIRRGEGTTYPSSDFVNLARTLGVEVVTLSSDSHSATDLSIVHLMEGLKVLMTSGFTEVYSFSRRRPSPLPLHSLAR